MIMENEMIIKQYVHKKDRENILFSVCPKTGDLTIESKKEKITIPNNPAMFLITEIQNDLLDHKNIKNGKPRFNIYNFILQKL
jgi:hypothetical protein